MLNYLHNIYFVSNIPQTPATNETTRIIHQREQRTTREQRDEENKENKEAAAMSSPPFILQKHVAATVCESYREGGVLAPRKSGTHPF